MRMPIALIALMAVSTPVLAQPAVTNTTSVVATSTPAVATKGQMLIGSDHSRLGSVVRVDSDGSVGIIFEAQMVTIPASTLKMADGKLTTSLSKHALTVMQ